MQTFTERLKQLNQAQTQAVQTIDGPLLVLAGPGTGKTTLLTMRVAHILKQTDTLPESILCLTFTDSAQKTMQTRLVDLIGQDAYKVRIHTFHSFGAWVMQAYPDYFQNLIPSQQADDVTRYQIFQSIFEALDHYDPIATTNDGDYLYLGDAMQRISQLKQAAVSPDNLAELCTQDQVWLDKANKAIEQDFKDFKMVSKNTIGAFEALEGHLESIRALSQLGEQAYLELRDALQLASAEAKLNTKPLTAWKNAWLVKKGDGQFELKYGSTLKKLQSLTVVYRAYQATMQKRQLTDYDDQLMLLLQAMRDQPDLLAEIQERFIYIMADEYQDTNGVQQRILETVADNPIHDGQPNIMVVGDDDQAIYGFQGAYSSNILDFLKRWREVQTIVLTENYRSTPDIVNFSRSIITQGENRLENEYEYINKALTTPNANHIKPRVLEAPSIASSYQAVSQEIRKLITDGVKPSQIAVLAPRHKYLERLVPYLHHDDVDIAYERRQDVLSEPHIYELSLLAETVVALSSQQLTRANTLLPELLSFKWWNLKSEMLWDISLQAHKQKKLWLEVMQAHSDQHATAIAEWLIKQSQRALQQPLEQALDELIGVSQRRSTDPFVSPYYSHYFLEQTADDMMQYLLSSLISLRRHIREYVGERQLRLSDFVDYIQLRKQSGLPIINDHPLASSSEAVQLMTAYKAKGMEFDYVYLLDSQNLVWAKPRGRSPLIAIAPHIAAVPSGETLDEYLRLFYVGITRAAHELTLVRGTSDDQNAPVLPLGWLEHIETQALLQETSTPQQEPAEITRGVTYDWHESVITFSDANWRDKLAERLQNYRLSATHLGTFLDVTSGGPRTFMISHLLRFPQAGSPNLAFGNAMHHTMQFLHNEMNANGSLPGVSGTFKNFESYISDCNLGDIETSKQINRGHRAIEALYANGLHLFSENQISELDLTAAEIRIGAAPVTGKIDLLDTGTGIVKDYKTGKPVAAWTKDGAKSYDALKLHRYRQQLLFYKLMLNGTEHNPTSAELLFLESADHKELQILRLDYDAAELDRLARLIDVIWQKIVTLDLPDVSGYPADVTGVRAFEDDLLSGL